MTFSLTIDSFFSAILYLNCLNCKPHSVRLICTAICNLSIHLTIAVRFKLNQCQFSSAFAAHISRRIHSPLAIKFAAARLALQTIAVRLRLPSAGKRLAIAAASDLLQQLFKIPIPVSVSPILQMKMVMAQFVLNNLFNLFFTMRYIMFPTDINMMSACKISSACSAQSAVKCRFVQKRTIKILQ